MCLRSKKKIQLRYQLEESDSFLAVPAWNTSAVGDYTHLGFFHAPNLAVWLYEAPKQTLYSVQNLRHKLQLNLFIWAM